jgi:hypothetical protein
MLAISFKVHVFITKLSSITQKRFYCFIFFLHDCTLRVLTYKGDNSTYTILQCNADLPPFLTRYSGSAPFPHFPFLQWHMWRLMPKLISFCNAPLLLNKSDQIGRLHVAVKGTPLLFYVSGLGTLDWEIDVQFDEGLG